MQERIESKDKLTNGIVRILEQEGGGSRDKEQQGSYHVIIIVKEMKR